MKEFDKVRDHAYDGIQEYDNPMPRWWINIFILTVVWSVIYVGGAITDDVPEYTHELKDDLRVAAMAEQARQAALPPVDEEMLATAIADPESQKRGAAIFAFNCANCHNQNAEGLIGPNLTDTAFLYDPGTMSTYDIIKNGTRKGMPEWGPILPRQELIDVMSYVISVRGTNPPNGKKPEGDIVTN